MKRSTNLKSNEANTIIIQTSSPLFNLACMAIIGGISLTATYLSHRQNTQAQSDTESAVGPATLNTQTQQMLHDILDDYFNEQELRDVCFDMGIDYEDLPFSGQTYKARELVGLCSRLGQIAELKAIIMDKRPHLFPIEPEQPTTNAASLPGQFFAQNKQQTGHAIPA